MVKKCLLTMGIFTIIAICFIYILVNLKYQNEWITYKPDLKSRLENNRDCFLCGENSKSLMGYYRNYGDLLLVYLPTWDIWPAHIVDEDMDATGSSSIMGSSQDGLYCYNTDIMKSRGISEITIQTTEEQSSKWDVEVLETMLCSSCLEKVAETLEISSARKECIPEPFCLVNAEDLRVYSLQRKDKTKMIGDYYVSIDFKSDIKSILAVYAPDNRMASLISVQCS